MVRGCQKRTVHVRDTGSKYYEEAFFILRPGALDGQSESDMIKEALRIAEESLRSATRVKRKNKKLKDVLLFSVGALCGAAVCALVMCLLIFR